MQVLIKIRRLAFFTTN